ncbi:MAG TPA: serine/threonine-protein kinase [Gemmataceae bacterium]|jgi:serine/threonine protein kinase
MSEPTATGDRPPAAGAGLADWPAVPGYEILAELGRGGMGVIYRAVQTGPGRPVALKLIRDGALAGPQDRARFRIEAEAAARLRHPNVIEVFEVGEHRGLPYYAMELAEGGSLDRHLAGRPQPAPWTAELIRTLARAVEHAHAHDVVHRDLKPANVLLAKSQAPNPKSQTGDSSSWDLGFGAWDYSPKVSDFGLAKRLNTDSTAWTQDGAVLGTAGYMAPEQAAGHAAAVGPAADVYALGAILYECLTGRPPFRAETWNETVEQVLHDEPAPPTRAQPGVPPPLEAVCLKCLEKDPAKRYPTAGALADDLGRFLGGTPVTAVPLAPAERLARLAARDGYRLAGELGRGPRSTVYRATFGPLAQAVAVKVFAAGACTAAEWDDRLRHGAEQWAALAHPQVALVQRAGWWDGTPYLALEYVPHGSLADRLTGRPHPVKEALRLVERLAEVVCYLHRQGIVHGNLKPANVLFAAGEIPRVVDLHPTGGLALGPLPAGDQDPAGLAHLVPELARDPAAGPRQHTDVYSLGAILYELLAGRPPFAGATAGEVLEQVCGRDPEPPSRFNSAVPPSLDWLCLRCLRKDPWRRFSRAYDVLRRLRDCQTDPAGRPPAGPRRAAGTGDGPPAP